MSLVTEKLIAELTDKPEKETVKVVRELYDAIVGAGLVQSLVAIERSLDAQP